MDNEDLLVNLALWGILVAAIALSGYMLAEKEREHDNTEAKWEDIKELCLGGVQTACDEVIRRAERGDLR